MSGVETGERLEDIGIASASDDDWSTLNRRVEGHDALVVRYNAATYLAPERSPQKGLTRP
jgi:hypothetical protein